MSPDLPRPRSRIDSIDLLRGIAMILMLLDHTRQLLSPTSFGVANLSETTPALFLTRWITHIAAPAFILLAGTAAFLYEEKNGREQTAKFLWTRGLWLIFLELTAVKLGWLSVFRTQRSVCRSCGSSGWGWSSWQGSCGLLTRCLTSVCT